MTEIEKVKSEIKVLESKLSLLEEIENHKSPVEEAYKRVTGKYPNEIDDYGSSYDSSWIYFSKGYNAAKQDWKVEETAQERGNHIHKEVEELLNENESHWKTVALIFGEKLSDIGPDGYYNMSPDEWYYWAQNTYEEHSRDKGRAALDEISKIGQECEDYGEDYGEVIREENDKNFKNSLDLIKEWGEKNKKPSLKELLWEWWDEDCGDTKDNCIDMLVDIIDKKFIPPSHDTNDYQWNKCLKFMREKLR